MDTEPHQCYYCEESSDDLQECINHVVKTHGDKTLKIRTHVLNENTGIYGFISKNFGFVPNEKLCFGQFVSVNSNDWTAEILDNVDSDNIDADLKSLENSLQNLTVEFESDDETIGSPFPKKLKCSTPLKQPQSDRRKPIQEQLDSCTEEVISVLPNVLEQMERNGHLETWLALHRLIASGSFPFDNIAFLLFMDVCRFFSCGNTSEMKYSDRIKQFWRIGYRLFHGKWLKFMSGPKHSGAQLTETCSKGVYDPAEAKINFAIPVKCVMSSKLAKVKPSDIKPGILSYLLDKVAETSDVDKTYKICLDGKKINASTSGQQGDIDLWGYEHKPTLKEKRECLQHDKDVIADTTELVNQVMQKVGNITVIEMHENDREKLKTLLLCIIQCMSKHVKSLREMFVQKATSKDRLMKEAGDDWRKSKLVFVISSLITIVYDIKACISNLLNTIDQACNVIASINCKQYVSESIVDMSEVRNYMHFDNGGSEPQVTKQRTEQWHRIRDEARVTGSTLNDALALRTLKKQAEHYDHVIMNISKAEPSDCVKEMMKHGTENEKHAVATLVSKILPVLHPDLVFYEEGCYPLTLQTVNAVISPDGSFRPFGEQAKYAIEIKCPFPGKLYTTPVQYGLPKYYVTQVLSEMKALDVKKLYFVSYSAESTTIQLVTFDEDLWNLIETEVANVYGGENPKRPTKKSEMVKPLQEKIDKFTTNNVCFVLEVPSVKAIECTNGSSSEIYCTKHTSLGDEFEQHQVLQTEVQETVYNAGSYIDRAYQLSRNKASEFLGFMISDLDREYKAEGLHSVPIAYGLKGYSLPTGTLREMLESVLCECARRGLYVPVCSFDGQWYRLAVRDRNEKPLTVLQLQKDVYNAVKVMSKAEIIRQISTSNVVEAGSFEELQEIVVLDWKEKQVKDGTLQRSVQVIEIGRKKSEKIYKLSKQTYQKIQERERATDENIPTDILVENDVLNNVPDNVLANLTAEVIDSVHSIISEPVANDVTELSSREFEIEEVQNAEGLDDNEQGVGDQNQQNGQQSMLDDADLSLMLSALQNDQKANTSNKWNMSLSAFKDKFSDASTINKSFFAYELQICIRQVIGKLRSNGEKITVSLNKHRLVNVLSLAVGDGSSIAAVVRKRKSVPKLKSLAKGALRRLSKEHLNVIQAENSFPEQLDAWYMDNPFGKEMNINSMNCSEQPHWYSRPEMNDTVGYYIFMILDAYHQLCGARRLVCANGMPAAGFHSSYMHSIAENCERNGCGLNSAHVKDLIDKQNVAFAVLTFSEKVEEALTDIGAVSEANFCRLMRNWYKAEDEPGISALDRCKYRLELRKWLLQNVNFGLFPPKGAYVKDIPVVLYEGLLTGIERRLQLFTFTKSGSYNVRAIGSLDIENFFGEFQDIDPCGTGVLRPDSIATALSVATELAESRLNPNRGFHMYTSSAKVYPCNVYEQSTADAMDINFTGSEERPVRDVTAIQIRDHAFDSSTRNRGKKKRKQSNISKPEEPGRRPLTVREHHRTHEAKILPHVRRGLNLKSDD